MSANSLAAMEVLQQINDFGYSRPQRYCSPWRARWYFRQLNKPSGNRIWSKSLALENMACSKLARDPRITSVVCAYLGGEVVLWVSAGPGHVHPWHSDLETAYLARSLTVWLGLHGVGETSMAFMQGSHRFGHSVQELQYQNDVSRAELSDAQVAQWASKYSDDARIERPNICNGHLVYFDGRTWYQSSQRLEKVRVALILQYMKAGIQMRRWEDFKNPYHLLEPLAPLLNVTGSNPGANFLKG